MNGARAEVASLHVKLQIIKDGDRWQRTLAFTIVSLSPVQVQTPLRISVRKQQNEMQRLIKRIQVRHVDQTSVAVLWNDYAATVNACEI
jgi:hypothetical protein